MKTFTKYKIKDLELKNRLVLPPMCMYSSDEEGMVKDFHRIHYGSMALGGVGLIVLEATAVVPNGRISSRDLGIWDDSHVAGLKSIVDTVHDYDSKIAIQLAHAGRKSQSNDELVVAPSALRRDENFRVPRELSREDIVNLVTSFKEAARRVQEAGFDAIEVHAAHGYLIHQFLSPLSNKREDEYGGSLENRLRFLKEIIAAIREEFPSHKPLIVRVSADDYLDGGIDLPEIIRIIKGLGDNIDLIHVSSGGLLSAKIIPYPGYQVTYSEAIRKECGLPTIAVGILSSFEQSEEILYNQRADLVAMGRALLRNPNLPLNMAHENNIDIDYPNQYSRGF